MCLLFRLGVVLTLRRPFCPDVNFGLRAIEQTTDVLTMRPYQQYGNHYREEDERNRRIAISAIDATREDGHKHREYATRHNRSERNIVVYHKDQSPHAEAVESNIWLNTRDCADERRHTLATFEAGKNRENVTDDSHKYGDDFQVDEPRWREVIVVAQQRHQIDSDKTLQEVDNKNRYGSTLTQHAKRVGRAGILAAVFADIDTVVAFTNPYGTRHRAEQIRDNQQC